MPSNGINREIRVHDLLYRRRSGRLLDPNRPVPDPVVLSLVEAARWAPSCFNHQPWRIVAVRDETLDSVKDCLTRGNAWAREAPLFFIFASHSELACRKTGREYYPLDLGLALENLLLQGIHEGLVVHPMAGFDEELLKRVLQVPDIYRIHVMVAAGYPGDPETADPKSVERDREPRSRKPISDIFHWERFRWTT